jgi:hypothetical protein
MDKLKGFVGVQDEEKGPLDELEDGCSLTWEQRFWGFVICIGVGTLFGIMVIDFRNRSSFVLVLIFCFSPSSSSFFSLSLRLLCFTHSQTFCIFRGTLGWFISHDETTH